MDGVTQKIVFLLFLGPFVYQRKAHLSGRNPKLHFNNASKIDFPHLVLWAYLTHLMAFFFYPGFISFIWNVLVYGCSVFFFGLFSNSIVSLGLMSPTFPLLMAWYGETPRQPRMKLANSRLILFNEQCILFSKGDQCRKDFWSAGIWGFVPSERRLLL